ncbi:unnamed protein product [Xylocopa violacea]|uniref:Uncharacterized protein n=1 Tax=Xylocopa violacea TaxID=135666 RepID=A0ABP1NSG3_XYLVO
MAIVEEAKHYTINCETAKHMEMTQVIPNETCIREDNNNDSYSEQYSQKTSEMSNFLLQPKDTNAGQNVTLGIDNDVYTLPEAVNMDGDLINRFTSCYNKTPNRKITCMFDNSQTRNLSIEQTFMSKDNMGIRYRKKLYTGRDSPIDLINMRSSNKCKIFNLKQNLHPALDHEYKYKLSKKYKMKRMRRINQAFTFYNDLINNSNFSILSSGKRIQRKKKPDFNKISKMILDTSKTVDTLSVNNNIEDNSVIYGMSVEHNGDHCLNTSLPINESTDETTANCTFNKSINHLEREFESATRTSINVNPVVHLVRLSEDIIARYLKSKKAMEVLNTADISGSPNFSDKYRDLKKPSRNESKNVVGKSTNINPVVHLVRLSEDVIARYSGSKKATEVLNTANITGSSKFNNKHTDLKEPIRSKKELEPKNYPNSTVNTSVPNIQKYKKSTYTKTNFNPVVVLKKLSKSDICKKVQLQNKNMNTFELTKCIKLSASNNSKSTLDTISPMYREPTSPQNIKTRQCNTVWIDESFVTSVSLSTCRTQSCSTPVNVSNKHTFRRETKITEEEHKLNKKVTNRPVRSTRTSSSYATGGESDESNSTSRVHKVLDVVATSPLWYESDEDGKDYEKFITSLEILNNVE